MFGANVFQGSGEVKCSQVQLHLLVGKGVFYNMFIQQIALSDREVLTVDGEIL